MGRRDGRDSPLPSNDGALTGFAMVGGGVGCLFSMRRRGQSVKMGALGMRRTLH